MWTWKPGGAEGVVRCVVLGRSLVSLAFCKWDVLSADALRLTSMREYAGLAVQLYLREVGMQWYRCR